MEGGEEGDEASTKSKAPDSSASSGKSKLSKAERDAVRARRAKEQEERAARKAARDDKRKANEAKRQELENDINQLLEKWREMYGNIKGSRGPKKLLGEINRTSSMLRDLLNGDFANIHVNNDVMYDEIKEYVSSIAPNLRTRADMARTHGPPRSV